MPPDYETDYVDIAGVVHCAWSLTIGGWFITTCGIHYDDLDFGSRRLPPQEPHGRRTKVPPNCFFCMRRNLLHEK